ncbi:hypothetical protein B0H19DRAFT_947446, partial [Mycena capillaripes]
NLTISRADRISVAEAALETAITFLDSTMAQFPDPGDSYGVSGLFYSQLAEFDLATNQTKYSNSVATYFALASAALSQDFDAQNFTGELNYGHGAAMAFTAYKNSIFLDYAKQVWWTARAYTLSQNDVNIGTVPLKNFTLNPTCHGITMAGGTFYVRLDELFVHGANLIP